MRHLAFRSFALAVQGQSVRALCGADLSDFGTALPGAPLCGACLGRRRSASQAESVPSPLKPYTLDEALASAEGLHTDGILSQAAYHRLSRGLTPTDLYLLDMALNARQIRVRRGMVNVVDRAEPRLPQGDAVVPPAGLWSEVGVLPSGAESNDSPRGTTELEVGRPRRTEGHADEGEHTASPGGWNLTDLTTAEVDVRTATARDEVEAGLAVTSEVFGAMLVEGVGLEYSQQLRYQTYAEVLRLAYRTPLADEFREHAWAEAQHAAFLAERATLMGAVLTYEIAAPAPMNASDPDVLSAILAELWAREQAGIAYYRDLRDAAGTSVLRHAIEEILVTELEHSDDLLRLGHVLHRQGLLALSAPRRAGAIVDGPNEPNTPEARRWNQAYTDENQAEGLERMGQVEPCLLCTGGLARVASVICPACAGTRWVARRAAELALLAPVGVLPRAQRVAVWRRRAEAVKRVTRFADLPIHLEYDVGDIRRGTNAAGEAWEREMFAAYGYIPGTTGADGEPIDVYLGEEPNQVVCVVHQLKDGSYDEDKVMLGFRSPAEAEAMYRAHYPNHGEAHFGGMEVMPLDAFLDRYVRPSSDPAARPGLALVQDPDSEPGDEGDEGEDEDEDEEDLSVAAALELEAVHQPGDADGCGEGQDEGVSVGAPLADAGVAVRELAQSDKALAAKLQQIAPSSPFYEAFKNKAKEMPASQFLGETKVPGIETVADLMAALEQAGSAKPKAKPPKEKAPKEPKAPKEKPAKEPKAPKEKAPKAPKAPKEKAPRTPKTKAPVNEAPPATPPPADPSAPKEPSPAVPSAPAEPPPAETTPPAAPPPAEPAPAPAPSAPATPPPPKTKAPAKKPKAPAQPRPAPSKAPAPAPAPSRGPAGMPRVDTSPVVSPAQQAWENDKGKLKEMWDQAWGLLGGPGFDPDQIGKDPTYTPPKMAPRDPRAPVRSGALYESPDHGPLGTDGEPGHPSEDRVTTFAELRVGDLVDRDAPYSDTYALPKDEPNKGFSGPAVPGPPVGGMSGLG
jgi:bacterioferritin (cytochrome b1)